MAGVQRRAANSGARAEALRPQQQPPFSLAFGGCSLVSFFESLDGPTSLPLLMARSTQVVVTLSNASLTFTPLRALTSSTAALIVAAYRCTAHQQHSRGERKVREWTAGRGSGGRCG